MTPDEEVPSADQGHVAHRQARAVSEQREHVMTSRRFRHSRLLAYVLVTLILGSAITLGAGYLGWKLLFHSPVQPKASEVFDLVRVSLLVAGAVGALVALVVSFRRQMVAEDQHSLLLASDSREERKVLSERFDSAVKLLGDANSAAVRLAGVYALASVADDWQSERQTCIDILCSYLRLSSNRKSELEGEAEVRLSIVNSIAEHLRGLPGKDWSGHRFNFTGATFAGESLGGLRVVRCTFDFRGARLDAGGFSISGSRFQDCRLDLSGLQVNGNNFEAIGCEFQSCRLTMINTALADGSITFANSGFYGEWDGSDDEEWVNFDGLQLTGGAVSLEACRFTTSYRGHHAKPLITFRKSELSVGSINMGSASISYTKDPQKHQLPYLLDFDRSSIHEASLDMSYFKAVNCLLSFDGVTLDGGKMIFRNMEIRCAKISFLRAKLIAGEVDFTYADLPFQRPTGRVGTRSPTALSWLDPVLKLNAEQRTRLHHLQLAKPEYPVIDFTQAIFGGAKIDFHGINGQAGLLNFAGTEFGDSPVTFRHGALDGTVVLLLLAEWIPGVGSITFNDAEPFLILGNYVDHATERIKFADPYRVAPKFRTAAPGQHVDWPNVIIISGGD